MIYIYNLIDISEYSWIYDLSNMMIQWDFNGDILFYNYITNKYKLIPSLVQKKLKPWWM